MKLLCGNTSTFQHINQTYQIRTSQVIMFHVSIFNRNAGHFHHEDCTAVLEISNKEKKKKKQGRKEEEKHI